MAPYQRLVISDLHEIGLVDEIDAINLKENALTSCRNLKPRKGRLACATKLGALVSSTPVFSGANYRTARIWKTYGANAKQLMLLGSEYYEYCDEDGNRSGIPHWMGLFGKTETDGTIAGNKMGALYADGDVFASNVGSKLTPADRIFLSELATGDSIVDAHFTKANGALPAGWTVEYGSMAVASNAAASTTLSWAVNDALSDSDPDNWLATIRYVTMTETSANAAAAIFVRDSATKRGYMVDVSYEYAEGDYGGPDEYLMRFYAGYINDATNIFANSLLIQNDVINTATDTDWEDYRDMWMWYRKPFISWGYGKRVMGTIPIEFDVDTLECGIVTQYAQIGPKQGSTHNPVMFWELTDHGPYTPSAVSYASNNATLTGVTTSMYGIAWGVKACDKDTHNIRATNEYAMRLAADIPLMIWKGGMLPEYCPNIAQPTAEGFGDYVYWTGTDATAFIGHLCLTAPKILVYLLNPDEDYYEYFPVLSYPTRMMYTVANAPDDWSGDGAGYIEFIDTPGEVKAIWNLRDTSMIYKADATIQLTPTGLADNPFRVAYFDMSIGADTTKCVVDAGKYHFFGRNESLYIVSTGDLSIVPTSSTLYNYRNAYRWDHDNTVIFGQYDPSSGIFNGRAYNYKSGTMYELYLSSISALDSANNYACALTAAGSVYGYSGQDIENATDFNPYSTAEYFETPQVTMGTIQYEKTIFTIDVIVRSEYTAGAYSPSVKLIVTHDGTSDAEETVTAETIGNGIYRARFTHKANGIYFKFKVTANDAATRLGYISYARIEVDYKVEGADKRTTAT
jgi:hypothetical protein